MLVSHYWVSEIQVAGLIVGLYGFFFLSISVFGVKSLPWFRALLPATGTGLGIALIGAVILERNIDSLALWILVLVASLLVYAEAVWFSSPRVSRSFREDKYLPRFLFGAAVLVTVLGAVDIGGDLVRYLNGMPFEPARADYWVLLAGSALLAWTLAALIWLPRILSESRLQKLGFLLSALAILTQFIPPVLDLLNIPVR